MPTYEYTVEMTCEGCSNAVNRVLSKSPGIASFEVDLPAQKVLVTVESRSSDEVLEILKKVVKATSFVGQI